MTGPNLFLGLMSGTSADGIDAALVRFDDRDGRLHAELLYGRTHAWRDDLRTRLVELGQGGDVASLDDFGQLDVQVGIAFAEAANALLAEAGIDAAGIRAAVLERWPQAGQADAAGARSAAG